MIMPTISLQFREQAVTSLFKKDDSHLFPMASRLMTSEEKAEIAQELSIDK